MGSLGNIWKHTFRGLEIAAHCDSWILIRALYKYSYFVAYCGCEWRAAVLCDWLAGAGKQTTFTRTCSPVPQMPRPTCIMGRQRGTGTPVQVTQKSTGTARTDLCNGTMSVRLSVPLKQRRSSSDTAPSPATGLRKYGDAARRSESNAGSAVFTATGCGWAQTFCRSVQWPAARKGYSHILATINDVTRTLCGAGSM